MKNYLGSLSLNPVIVKSGQKLALLQNSVEKYLDRRRRERSEPGATSPRRMVMRHGGGTECERGVFRAKRKRERVSATPIERHEEAAEERLRGAFGRCSAVKP